MKINIMVPVAFVLLAVLTIGAVAASDDFSDAPAADNVCETLGVSLDEDVLNEMGPEDVSIEVRNIDRDDTQSDFADVFLTEKDGSFAIYKDEGDETRQLYRQDISTSDKVDGDETYHLGISLDEVNAYIAEDSGGESDFYDAVAPGDVLRFVLEYGGDDLAVKTYNVDFDENTIFFNEEGGIGCFIWNGENGPLYTDHDGRVIGVDVPDIGGSIAVYVNGNEYNWQIDDGYHEWSLEDLEITEPGRYDVCVKYVGDDDEQVIAESTLDVVEFANDTFRAVISYNDKKVRFFAPDASEGTIIITVERFDESLGDYVHAGDYTYDINDEYYGQWIEFYFNDLNVPLGASRIRVDVSGDEYSYEYDGNLESGIEIYVGNYFDDGKIYSDNRGYILEIKPKEGFESGTAEITVNGVCLFITNIYMPPEVYKYSWTLNTLNMTEPGEYDVGVKLTTIDGVETHDFRFEVVEFKNDTFRVKQHYIEEDDIDAISLFCPDGAAGTVSMTLHRWDEENGDVPAGDYTCEITADMYNRWNVIHVLEDDCGLYDFRIDGVEMAVEDEPPQTSDVFSFEANDWGNMYEDNCVARIEVPFDQIDSNVTFTIKSGDNELFSIIISELQTRPYEWRVAYGAQGCYVYEITFDEVDYFSSLSDKDPVMLNLSVNGSIGANLLPYWLCHLQKSEGFARLHYYEAIRIDPVEILFPEYDGEEGMPMFNISRDDVFLTIGVPDELNITDTAVVEIAYADRVYIKDLKDFSYSYQYGYLGNVFEIPVSALHPESLNGGEAINVTLKNADETIGHKTIFAYFGDEGLIGVENFEDGIDVEFHFGDIGNALHGMDIYDGNLMIVSVPYFLNITDGAVQLIADDGTVLFSKSLSEFDEDCIDEGVQSRGYMIHDNVTQFDYSCIPEGVNFTAAFTYENTTLTFDRGVRIGDVLYHISTPADVARLFKVTVSEGILCNGQDNAVIIEATNEANRQSIVIDIGGGYFAVYVNGKKVEDLGRLVRVDNETELELFRLCSGWQGFSKLQIPLPELNVTENGVYNIRVTYVTDGEEFHGPVETELYNKNITLTSNVKVNYQNNTTELLTGCGIDPVLMYLDTYYDDISATNGTVTVLNSKGSQILSRSIQDLTYENGRYILKYSDFEDKDFTDSITVTYSNGNERDGQTTMDVLWKDVESDDFTPTVNTDVDDYYGDFVNMNIPAVLATGQIIVTIKFKNNHGSSISNMNVTTDFGSQAVYRFNVADIKANYENNDFKLSLSDLGFYEVNGDYDVTVQFTGDGSEILNITDSTLKVEFSNDILISINETSRYSNELPFASVKVFEPLMAYAELYIDGELYQHKNFEKGRIIFDSSASWSAGNHTAELIVYDSEFASVLNSSKITFETLIHTDDVEVSMNDTVREGDEVIVTIDVIKDSEASIQIDNGEKTVYMLNAGRNAISMGVLSYGNHSVAIAYNATLDDGTPSFYTNCLSVFVGDDGRWLDLPEPLVLDNDDTVRMDFGPDAQGSVTVTIDDVVVANQTLVNGTAEVSLTDFIVGENRYGEHTYNITYSGDDKHDSLSKAGKFNVTYLFTDNLLEEGFPLTQYYIIVITLPGDASGSVSLTVEGEKYTSSVMNGEATFEVPNPGMGEHDVTVEYSGDDKYPSCSYTNILNVSYYAVVGDFANSKRIVSLMLPKNATGNLTVYNDNRQQKLYSKALADGFASIDLSSLTVGKYEIRAVYEASDYEVRQFTTSFDVLPKIYISQNITVGETGRISVDLDNSVGHLLILIEGASPVLLEIEDGKIDYTFSTEDLSKGNHSVSFQYFGNSFDGNIFYALNNRTGYFMPINYNMHLLAKLPQVNMTPGDDWIIIDCGNATGAIEVFVNGVSQGIYNIVNGIALVDLSQFKDGNYNITFVYSGDRVYDGFVENMLVNVQHKVPKITAKYTTVLYTAKGKYSVTVYDENDNPVSDCQVSFKIAGKVYKTSKTNSKGVASIVIGKNPGTYKITAEALGVSAVNTLKVKHLVTLKKVTVKRSAKKLVLTATLSKVNKKYLKNKKVTFKFNGKKYTAKTNKKGVAKVTIKSSVLKKLKAGKKVTYQATYLKDTVKKTVKVKK